MPHVQATCIYCKAPMESRIHASMVAFHGTCRLVELRRRWREAATDLERDILKAEADTIKEAMQ
jgi:hypothetical protein